MTADLLTLVVGAAFSLAASAILVIRIERLGERLGLTEAMLGLVAALAADAPEITSAASALARGQHAVGVGVVLPHAETARPTTRTPKLMCRFMLHPAWMSSAAALAAKGVR